MRYHTRDTLIYGQIILVMITRFCVENPLYLKHKGVLSINVSYHFEFNPTGIKPRPPKNKVNTLFRCYCITGVGIYSFQLS